MSNRNRSRALGAAIAAVLILIAGCAEEPAPQAVEPAVANTAQPPIEESIEPASVAAQPPAPTTTPTQQPGRITLAQADQEPSTSRFQPGTHYQRFPSAQGTSSSPDMIEVAEIFWYGCPHCYTFEPAINSWAENKPANVRFVRIPAMWNGLLVLHARLFYTEQSLVRNGVIEDPEGFRNAVFEEYHRRSNRLASEEAIQRLFARFGVSEDEFARTWNSFEVDQNLRKAADLNRRYSVASVPAIVVNGKYRTGAQEVGGNDKWLELVDELVARESIR